MMHFVKKKEEEEEMRDQVIQMLHQLFQVIKVHEVFQHFYQQLSKEIIFQSLRSSHLNSD